MGLTKHSRSNLGGGGGGAPGAPPGSATEYVVISGRWRSSTALHSFYLIPDLRRRSKTPRLWAVAKSEIAILTLSTGKSLHLWFMVFVFFKIIDLLIWK